MAAPQFPVNTSRFDPYKNMKFRIKWDGKYVAGVSKIGALKRSTEPVTHREGGDPSTSRVSPAFGDSSRSRSIAA
jgi:phage tail-like protein